MQLALLNRFDARILDVIKEHVSKRPVIDWKRVYGYTFMYKIRHFVTDSHPRGGYVYFHGERKTGWYRWYMDCLDDEPQYTWLTLNDMAYKWEYDGRSEYMAILPAYFHDDDWSHIDELLIMASSYLESLDR